MTNSFDCELFAAIVAARRGTRSLRDVISEISPHGSMSPSTLSRVENGKQPDMDTMMTLCDWCGVPAASFFQPSRAGADDLPASAQRVIALIRVNPQIADAIETIMSPITAKGDRDA